MFAVEDDLIRFFYTLRPLDIDFYFLSLQVRVSSFPYSVGLLGSVKFLGASGKFGGADGIRSMAFGSAAEC